MKVDRIRGSIDVPLDAKGRAEAEHVGRMFAKAGDLNVIICSDLRQAKQTAIIIGKYSPKAIGPEPTPDLHPWPLGELGESFDQFRNRVLDFMEDLVEFEGQHPEKYVVVTHFQVVKLLEAWCEAGAGAKRDFPVDSMNQMKKEGSVFKLVMKPAPRLVPTTDPRTRGVYVVRHGSKASS